MGEPVDPRHLPSATTSSFAKRLLNETPDSLPSQEEEVSGITLPIDGRDTSSLGSPEAGILPGALFAPKPPTDSDAHKHRASAMETSLPAPSHVQTIACMVTHGMGQQVPFETCASIAETFAMGDRKPTRIEANRVQLTTGAELMTRMELDFPADPQAGLPATTLHIYEGYWAPLTEGKISFTKTMTFCISAGAQALWSSRQRTHTVDTDDGRKRDIEGNFLPAGCSVVSERSLSNRTLTR